MVKVTLKTELLNSDSKLPTRSHPLDTGLDLYANQRVIIWPGETKLVPFGVKVQLPKTFSGEIRPRSGMSLKSGLKCLLGTIDSGYRGEVNGIFVNVSDKVETIEVGDRVAQFVVRHDTPTEVIEVEQVYASTDRATNGFGSTGKK